MALAELLSHGLVMFLGAPLYLLMRRAAGGPGEPVLFAAAYSYMFGEVGIVCLLFVSSLLGTGISPLLPSLLAALCWAGAAAIMRRGRQTGGQQRAEINLLQTAALLLFVVFLSIPNIELSHYRPLIAWDARSIWFFHGKAFFYDNGISPNFLGSPAYQWSHPDYPVFIPLLAAFHARVLGQWSEVANKSFIFVHWLFAQLILYRGLRLHGVALPWACAALALVQLLFAYNAHLGYGDSLFSLALASAALFASAALERRDDAGGRRGPKQPSALLLILLAAMLGAAAALIKREGLVFTMLLYAGLGVVSALRCRGRFAALAASFGMFLLLALPWYVYAAASGLRSEYGWSIGELFGLTFEELAARSVIIGQLGLQAVLRHWGPSAVLLYIAALAALLLQCLRPRSTTAAGLLHLLLLLAAPCAVYLAYLSTPIDLSWHLQTSIERLLTVIPMLSLTALCLAAALHGDTR